MPFVTGVFDLINKNRSVFAVVLTQLFAAIGRTSVYIYNVEGQPLERRPKLTWVHSRIIPLEPVPERKTTTVEKTQLCSLNTSTKSTKFYKLAPQVFPLQPSPKIVSQRRTEPVLRVRRSTGFPENIPIETNVISDPIPPNSTPTCKRPSRQWFYLRSKVFRIRDIRSSNNDVRE